MGREENKPTKARSRSDTWCTGETHTEMETTHTHTDTVHRSVFTTSLAWLFSFFFSYNKHCPQQICFFPQLLKNQMCDRTSARKKVREGKIQYSQLVFFFLFLSFPIPLAVKVARTPAILLTSQRQLPSVCFCDTIMVLFCTITRTHICKKKRKKNHNTALGKMKSRRQGRCGAPYTAPWFPIGLK